MEHETLSAKVFDSGEALRAHRQQVHLSQMKLAKRANVQAWKIIRFELGELDADRFTDPERERIAAALQAEVNRLRNFTFGETVAAGVDAA